MNKFERLLEKFLKDSNKKHKDIFNRLQRKSGTKKKPAKKDGGNKHD